MKMPILLHHMEGNYPETLWYGRTGDDRTYKRLIARWKAGKAPMLIVGPIIAYEVYETTATVIAADRSRHTEVIGLLNAVCRHIGTYGITTVMLDDGLTYLAITIAKVSDAKKLIAVFGGREL